ncbi:Asparagine synthetase [glutamine-hydrolyzing] 3 [BD1-7 clade bacterium]|uniref:asparagine synthase (glutamine-hydrolyzing) n=1 Tax=BD1-7 clade bacterium TaxID=2029982 RepID=A0A5S9PT80_9GAMM|nr:Asparagine synthetase [glutamine-hydrolyzing] 3 [BD1-7 clade bacterium]
MSGFGGIVQTGEQRVDLKNVERMMGALRPYGPDNQKTLIRPRVSMLHTLMRITPEDFFERQPLSSAAGHMLCADVRLDNRRELASQLAVHPAQLKMLPDSQLILKAYEKWGEECLNHLLGDFSFALWDARTEKLFAAVDHFGNRPIFYNQQRDCFSFANDIKAILALPWVTNELNEQKLAEFTVLLHADASASVYRDVTRVPGGHYLTVTNQGLDVRRYYALEDNIKDVRFNNPDDYSEALRSLLEQAVTCRLRSAYPIASELSGGLDSSSVACLAAIELAKSGKSLATYTAVPDGKSSGIQKPGWDLDERSVVESLRQWYPNIDLNFMAFGSENSNMFSSLEWGYGAIGFPGRNFAGGWGRELALKARGDGARVLLSGSQGNLTISWAGECFLSELIADRRWLRWGRWASSDLLERRRNMKQILSASFVPFIPDVLWAKYQQYRACGQAPWSAFSLINPQMAKDKRLADRHKELGWGLYRRRYARSRDSRVMAILNGAFCDSRDRLSASRAFNGIERRDPTLDKRVVEFCLGVPEQEYCRDGVPRSLVRRAMYSVLPPEIACRQRRGAQPHEYSSGLYETASDLRINMEKLASSDQVSKYLDIPRMRQLLEQAIDGDLQGGEARRAKLALVRAYSVGGFIRYVEGDND